MSLKKANSAGDTDVRASAASGSKHPGGAASLRRRRRPTGGAREGGHPLTAPKAQIAFTLSEQGRITVVGPAEKMV